MKLITKQTIEDLMAKAASSPRKRQNLNLHQELSDPINRFLNAGLPESYIRPHRHRLEKFELVSVLHGMLDVIIFDPDGKIEQRHTLAAGSISLVEVHGGQWHTFTFHAPVAVALEVKPGPYEPALDKEFADWAPAETDSGAPLFRSWLDVAGVGDQWRPDRGLAESETRLTN